MRKALILAVCLAGAPSIAHATAFAAVDLNFFSLTPYRGEDAVGNFRALNPGEVWFSIENQTLTPTIITSGNANATAIGGASIDEDDNRLFASVSASALAFKTGYAFARADLAVRIAIHIADDSDLIALELLTDFSSFNPGGNPIGAQVDNLVLEFARFDSRQEGEGIGDFHSCDTRNLDPSDPFPAPPGGGACGVQSPDSSEGFVSFSIPAERVIAFDYWIAAEVEASSVPEPQALAVLLMALASAALLGRRGTRI
jgi:hypothetical protein